MLRNGLNKFSWNTELVGVGAVDRGTMTVSGTSITMNRQPLLEGAYRDTMLHQIWTGKSFKRTSGGVTTTFTCSDGGQGAL